MGDKRANENNIKAPVWKRERKLTSKNKTEDCVDGERREGEYRTFSRRVCREKTKWSRDKLLDDSSVALKKV